MKDALIEEKRRYRNSQKERKLLGLPCSFSFLVS
jgi:hypothetical protein